MKVAILGATSLIAQELVREWVASNKQVCLHLYARNVEKLDGFINQLGCDSNAIFSKCLSQFPDAEKYDAIINCIGVGDPSKAKAMSDSIMSVTFAYDDIVLKYIEANPSCKYIFLSSGAAYGSDFSQPATESKKATFDINKLQETETYGLAKFVTEIKHRNLHHLPIIDVRVFNFFSRNQDLSSKFFITDVLRSIKTAEICEVNSEPMVRDYLHPKDFCQIIDCLLNADNINIAVDCYSLAPVDKLSLLNTLQDEFGLKWHFNDGVSIIRATGSKCNYYSENRVLDSLGYKPVFDSKKCIITEFNAVIGLE